MKISIIQSNPKTNDFEGNAERLEKAILEADKDGAEIIAAPYSAITGFGSCQIYANPPEYNRAQMEKALSRLAALKTKAEIILGAVYVAHDKFSNDSVAVIKNGNFHICQEKTLDEENFLLDLAGKKVFVSMFSEDIYYGDISEKPDFMLFFGEDYYRRDSIKKITYCLSGLAKKEKVPAIYINPCGGNDSDILFGNSMVISPEGKILGEAPAFEDVILTVDTEKAVPYNPEPREDIADMANALVMGIRDFFEKQGFSKAVLGLSGGIDSAVAAALTAKAIGGENVLGVLMPSEYTSQDSIDQALELAKNLNMPTRIVPIKNIFNTLKQEIGLSDEKTENGKVSLALQNLQSRSRGITIMALSNSEGRIAIATGNKSEIAVGYCTLYGDTVGSIAPIADLLKTEVYELAEYINRHKEIIPKGTITRPPSAELSPNQKDEDDLPPYSQLDKIVRMFVEEDRDLEEIKKAGILEDVAIKTIRRIENNEFKRRQLPMGLKIAKGASFFYEWDCPLVKKNLY
ncbi:MAG: NAD(+) synthase [Elusimicrobiales bacterium]|nr:NAD(+) synthase [Elusimicrobiales bacterium]